MCIVYVTFIDMYYTDDETNKQKTNTTTMSMKTSAQGD